MGNIQFLSLKKAISRKRRLCIWVLGGPCSGRTSQCKLLAEQFHLAHISPQALIRSCLDLEHMRKPEARLKRLRRKRIYAYNAIKVHEKMTQDEKDFLGEQQQFAPSAGSSTSKNLFTLGEDSPSEDENPDPVIRSLHNSIRKGHPIDPAIIAALIKEAMQRTRKHCNGYLIDGYPRDSEQAEHFIKTIGSPHVLLYLENPLPVLKERILKRAKLTQRLDDNEFIIRYKFQSFQKYSEPLIQEWSSKLSAQHIDGNKEIDEVNKECIQIIEKTVGLKFKFKKFLDKGK